ncbi:LOW QUALITY PROTEIN: acyl-coenzyme A thioesterase 1 [Procambarus clarkii]|uniref:LOW QUALITY PROTEIN: acyl-coenzyme A thioesterase 1 n=1 Tax=Procambarus clarkii TaxID=6728 RepID=UPI003741FBEA
MGGWVRSVAGQADILARCVARGRGQWPVWAPWRRGLATTCPTHTGGAWITATPRVCLHDVPTTLRAGGLPPNAPVTLSALIVDENGKQFVSNAHYVSDALGVVDTGVAEAVSGSYTGVFPAGLLTSLAPAPHEFPLLRLYRRIPHHPWKVTVGVSEGHQPLERGEEAVVAKVELERHLMAPGVRRVPVREGNIRATMYLPAGQGPFPAVIDMFGAIGGLMEFRSALLASRGIASLALAYFAYEDLPKTTDRFDLEYFEEAVQVLLSQPGVVSDRCGVVATSKGADIAFCMATWFPQVKAMTCISGSPVALDSTISYRGSTLVEGVKINFNDMSNKSGMLYPSREIIAREMSPEHPKFIPFHLADDETYFLMVAGDDDAWSCDLAVAATQQRMKKFGRGDKIETVVYPGAGHILEPPYGPLIHHSYHRNPPLMSEDGSQKMRGIPMLWGGNAKGHCVAQEDLWRRMRAFITKHVRDHSPLLSKTPDH